MGVSILFSLATRQIGQRGLGESLFTFTYKEKKYIEEKEEKEKRKSGDI